MPHDARSSARSAALSDAGAEPLEVDAVAEVAQLARGDEVAPPHELDVLGVLDQLDVGPARGERLQRVDERTTEPSGSSGVAYRPWTVLTTIGTPARRPTTRPYSPGFGLCVCSTVGRSRRRIRHSSRAARRSDHGFQPRVDAASGTWRTPRCSIVGDERARRADPDGLTAGGDDGVELRSEEQRQAHVDRRQVGDAQRPRRQRRLGVPGPRNSVIVTPGAWSMPSPRRTMPTVRARMRASRASDAWSTYQTSRASRSSHAVVLRPFTWAQPVMPGRTSSRRACVSS